MKKIFTFLSGILFLVTIFNVWGCKKDQMSSTGEVPKKVTIYLKSVDIDGKKHLEMSDYKNINVIDSLTTVVDTGTIVLWKLKSNSGIMKITKIYPTEEKRNVFKKNPSKKFLSKTYKLVVPVDAESGKEREKYAIDYIMEDGTPDSIDPYIRIEDEN